MRRMAIFREFIHFVFILYFKIFQSW